MRFFSFLLFHIPIFFNLSQVWQYKTSNDYVFNVKDKWGELNKYSIKFIISDDSTMYEYKTEGHQDNWIEAKFPDDFILIKGDPFSSKNQKEYQAKAEVNKQIIFNQKIFYTPGPKGLFQLKPTRLPKQVDNYILDQAFIDSYSWEDNNGLNYIVRTESNDTINKHLYFYQFLIKNENIFLLRKHTDYCKDCNIKDKTHHDIESIIITDLNQDIIAETTFCYYVGCSTKQKKMILFTDGKKYLIRQDLDDNKLFKADAELTYENEFKRFMIKKWINSDN